MARNLFGLTVTAQQSLAVSLAADLLGYRPSASTTRPMPARGRVIGLDKAGATATDTLKGLAPQAPRQRLQDRAEAQSSPCSGTR